MVTNHYRSIISLASDATTQGDMASEIRFRELALEEKKIEAEQEQKRELRKMVRTEDDRREEARERG